MRFRNGLTLGGRVRRDHVAYVIIVPLASLHRPGWMEWSWGCELNRARHGSGVRHSFFRIVKLPGHQARTIVDLLWLGSFEFVRQKTRETCTETRSAA